MSRAARGGIEPQTSIPSFDLGGSGQQVHFLHANGYPPDCYQELLQRLRPEGHVFGMLLRPLWPNADPQAISDWAPFSEDLRQFLEERHALQVIGIGHSIGAVVTLRAALRDPDLFRAMILIDPVLLPQARMFQLRVARALGLANRLKGRIAGALGRRRHFDSLQKLFAGYRRRDVFRFFSDEYLRTLIRGMTRPAPDGGYELVYSPEWEARIYETGIWNDWDIWRGIKQLRIPTLIIRGAETDTFWASTGRMMEQRNPGIKVVSVAAATHLLPLERPDEVFDIIREFLEGVEKTTASVKGKP